VQWSSKRDGLIEQQRRLAALDVPLWQFERAAPMVGPPPEDLAFIP
jgi:hypothetical protein